MGKQIKFELVFGIFSIIILVVVLSYQAGHYNKSVALLPNIINNSVTNINNSVNNSVPDSGTQIKLTIAEVAKHNTPSDCWFIVQNKVYNVTGFLRLHPGGADQIIPYCGKDGSQAFLTRGGLGHILAELIRIWFSYI